MGFRDKPGSPTARPEARGAPQSRKPPAAPAAYRPQPTPRVLQTKAHAAGTSHAQSRRPTAAPPANRRAPEALPAGMSSVQAKTADRAAAPPPARPRPTPRVLQAKPSSNRPGAAAERGHGGAPQRAVTQAFKPGVVQAIKFYPNLHPGAVERVEPGSLFRLESFTDQYRLRKAGGHGAYVPNQLYNFVRTAEGQTLLHNRYRHPSIAEGRQVLYAGEAYFNNGRLQWWSNGSGHYQPDADDAAQAGLPLDYFYTYQQVIKGEHKRKGGR